MDIVELLEEELHVEYGLTIDYRRVSNQDGVTILEERKR